jgi:hypothetical protein
VEDRLSEMLLSGDFGPGDTVRIGRKTEGETDELVIEKVTAPEPEPALA